LVSLVYEGRNIDPESIDDIGVDDPVKEWLFARLYPHVGFAMMPERVIIDRQGNEYA
jgi:hypothetical protein